MSSGLSVYNTIFCVNKMVFKHTHLNCQDLNDNRGDVESNPTNIKESSSDELSLINLPQLIGK